MNEKTKKRSAGKTVLLLLLALLLLAAAVGGSLFGLKLYRRNKAPAPLDAWAGTIEALYQPPAAETAWGRQLREKAEELLSFTYGETREDGLWARTVSLELHFLDTEQLTQGAEEELQDLLAQRAQAASRVSEIYDEQLHFQETVTEQAFDTLLAQRLEAAEDCLSSLSIDLTFSFSGTQWELTDQTALEELLQDPALQCDWDSLAQALYARAAEGATFVPLQYHIDEDALSGPVPAQENFGETEDPAVIQALLDSPLARQLIGDQTTAWSPDLNFIPGRPFCYYLDESLLVLVWQEITADRAVGTFSEVFIADGSQLRRRIAGDRFQSFDFQTTSAFARESNGVLTVGGDFYHHSRACGIVVYQREIYRFDPETCDTCYITADGDMLFSYRYEFEDQAQAQAFIEENDVLFSLCFGPVLIDGGEDVTPEKYPWGQIQERYARSALGLLGEKHYLTLNINCEQPYYYHLVELHPATDAMLEKGCLKAYALDGGQTATTVFNGELINPVQFGWQKIISDVIYFATAVPNE